MVASAQLSRQRLPRCPCLDINVALQHCGEGDKPDAHEFNIDGLTVGLLETGT